ncbi:probable chitinase 10 [Tribolium madens]|uniref:probable chitinase 10 n=1 Tax=Tribolium madens TaxID=41895 RepID=UPI001CF75AD6|nr:probable chitinase 10 [Tribolium madens]
MRAIFTSVVSFFILTGSKNAVLSSSIKPRQNVQQFQIAVVLPPGQNLTQGGQTPSPANPGFVWVQVPVTPPNQPAIIQPPSPVIPPINQPPLPAIPPNNQPIPDDLSKKCQKSRGQFPSNSCNKYINCWDGVAVEQFCPEGLLFSPRGYCDYPENVNCGGRPIEGMPPSSATPGQATTVAPPTLIVTLPTIDPNLRKKCLKPRGQFRSDTCNKFVNCWDDVVIEQECPKGLLFSNNGYCDYPNNVNCGSTTNPEIRNDIKSECPLEFGTFRDRQNCSNYFTCIGGKIVANYTCPSGFNFNDNIGVCDYEDRVDCSKEPLIFSPKANFLSNIPKDFMSQIENCKPGSVFALNPQCTAACLCHDGLSEVVQCPVGLAYDSKTDKCLLPHLAKC